MCVVYTVFLIIFGDYDTFHFVFSQNFTAYFFKYVIYYELLEDSSQKKVGQRGR